MGYIPPYMENLTPEHRAFLENLTIDEANERLTTFTDKERWVYIHNKDANLYFAKYSDKMIHSVPVEGWWY